MLALQLWRPLVYERPPPGVMKTNLLTGGRRRLGIILVLERLHQRPTAFLVGTNGRQEESLPPLCRV